LLKASARAFADIGQRLFNLTSVDMVDQVKLPIVEQSGLQEKGAAKVNSTNPADRRWFFDRLEDDEVRETSSTSAVSPSRRGEPE